jgi:anti-sigma regulatory factor (Ser/Thr protein kinase)
VTDSNITSTVVPLAFMCAYPATAEHVGRARRSLSRVLNGFPAAGDAVLCLSELVTNALVHSRSRETGGHFTVRAWLHAGHLRVEVCDDGGPWTPPARRRDDEDGRGLLLVASLASHWGRTGDGAAGWTVWFEIHCPSPPAQHAASRARQLLTIHDTQEKQQP